jgi:hypothetical protein
MGADERYKRRYFNRNNDVLRWGGFQTAFVCVGWKDKVGI